MRRLPRAHCRACPYDTHEELTLSQFEARKDELRGVVWKETVGPDVTVYEGNDEDYRLKAYVPPTLHTGSLGYSLYWAEVRGDRVIFCEGGDVYYW